MVVLVCGWVSASVDRCADFGCSSHVLGCLLLHAFHVEGISAACWAFPDRVAAEIHFMLWLTHTVMHPNTVQHSQPHMHPDTLWCASRLQYVCHLFAALALGQHCCSRQQHAYVWGALVRLSRAFVTHVQRLCFLGTLQ